MIQLALWGLILLRWKLAWVEHRVKSERARRESVPVFVSVELVEKRINRVQSRLGPSL